MLEPRAPRARCSSRPASRTTQTSSASRAWVHLLPGRLLRQAAPVPHRGVATAGLGSLRPLAELTGGDCRSRTSSGSSPPTSASPSSSALRQLGLLRAAADRRVGARGAEPPRLRAVQRWATVMATPRPETCRTLVALALRRARMCENPGGSAPGGAVRRCSRSACSRSPTRSSTHRWPQSSTRSRSPTRSRPRCCATRAQGRLLAAVGAYERGEFPTLHTTTPACVAGAYRAAVAWADDAVRALADRRSRLHVGEHARQYRAGAARARPQDPRVGGRARPRAPPDGRARAARSSSSADASPGRRFAPGTRRGRRASRPRGRGTPPRCGARREPSPAARRSGGCDAVTHARVLGK